MKHMPWNNKLRVLNPAPESLLPLNQKPTPGLQDAVSEGIGGMSLSAECQKRVRIYGNLRDSHLMKGIMK